VSDKYKQTVRIVRRPKVRVDDRGRNVWAEPIEEAELDLVSTAMLKRVLSSEDEVKKQQIRDAAVGKDGVLAHDPEKDRFEIIDDADLEAALQAASKGMDAIKAADVQLVPLSSRADNADEELSLVSTQALRRILDPGSADTKDAAKIEPDDSGFDPYNSG
jgi:hypothetical protein